MTDKPDFDLAVARALADEAEGHWLPRQDSDAIAAMLRAACGENERLRKFVELETEQCPKSHVGGPCGQCTDRRTTLASNNKEDK